MKSYNEYLAEIFNDSKKWDYYNKIDKKWDSLEKINEHPDEFIKKYLDNGGKSTSTIEQLIDNLEDSKEKKTDRLAHTMSIFWFGLILYENNKILKKRIDDIVSKSTREIESTDNINSDMRFCYFWFLICFFHDLGYGYQDQEDTRLFGKKGDLEIGKVVVEILEQKSKSMATDCSTHDREWYENCIPECMLRIWKPYLEYHRECVPEQYREKINHGMLAGALLLHHAKNLIKKSKNKRFSQNGSSLHISETLMKTALIPIGLIIASHAIWFNPHLDDLHEDLRTQLKPLCTNKKPELSEYPIYWLLCVVDTLDPSKVCYDKSAWKDNLKIDFTEDKIYFKQPSKPGCMKRKIDELAEWLDLSEVKINPLSPQ